MAPVGLKHWMLHNDQLAHEYDETLKLSPGFDPVRAVDPGLSFYAPLLTGVNSIPGAIRAAFERNSEATYWAPRGAFLLPALDDESRHEYTPDDEPLGLRMDPAATNVCENYNANPDAALTHVTVQGGPGILSRELQMEKLQKAGLQRVCRSGYAFKIDATAGLTDVGIAGISGAAENQIGAYIYCAQGSGHIAITAGGGSIGFSENEGFEWIGGQVIPAAPNTLQIRAQAGSIIYWVLNELEVENARTSVIETRGAATSRALDRVRWPLAGDPKGLNITDSWFDSEANWDVVNPAVTLGNDQAVIDYSGGYAIMLQAVDVLTVDDWYQVKIRCSEYTSGVAQVFCGNVSVLDVSSAGDYEIIARAESDGRIQIAGSDIHLTLEAISYRRLEPILSQAEGMAAVRVTFGWSFDDTTAGQQQSFIAFRAGEVSLLYHNNSSGTSWLVSRDDAATFAEVQFPPGKPEKGEHYLLMVRWGNGTFQVGFKIAGTVTWSATQPYVGRFDEEGEMHFSYITKLPLHGRDLHVWSEDRGTAWLESFFEGVAN